MSQAARVSPIAERRPGLVVCLVLRAHEVAARVRAERLEARAAARRAGSTPLFPEAPDDQATQAAEARDVARTLRAMRRRAVATVRRGPGDHVDRAVTALLAMVAGNAHGVLAEAMGGGGAAAVARRATALGDCYRVLGEVAPAFLRTYHGRLAVASIRLAGGT